MARREYNIEPTFINERQINKVIIDDHYMKKHGSSVSDGLILYLVTLLNQGSFFYEDWGGDFQYYSRILRVNKRSYRLVWLFENSKDYIGVINAYRDDRER